MNQLTREALLGYGSEVGAKCPHIYSSPAAIAWYAGQWLRDTGRSAPRGVRMSRGYSIRVNDMLLAWQTHAQFERIN